VTPTVDPGQTVSLLKIDNASGIIREILIEAEGAYFTAIYHSGETVYGHDWLLDEGQGPGWFVGVVQSMMNSHYCEGNEHFTLDGAVSPQLNGTGTEDYYLACFWPNPDFDTPFGCVAGNILEEGGGDLAGAYHVPASYSRFHLEAPIPFFSAIDARIQHGGQSDILSNYRSLGFAYVRKSPALFPTDSIIIGLPASEKAHGYEAAASSPATELSAYPEGEHFETRIKASGRHHTGGEIRFRIAVDPANDGVRLRRRIDQKNARQKALVYVDGRYAGCWYYGYENEYLRWNDTDFEIASSFSRGRKFLEIKLLVKTDDGEDAFSDFGYSVYCYK